MIARLFELVLAVISKRVDLLVCGGGDGSRWRPGNPVNSAAD